MSATPATEGIDTWLERIRGGAWLGRLPPRWREPVARAGLQVLAAAVLLVALAPAIDAGGAAWLDTAFGRTLAALAATRGLDAAISVVQSSELSFSLGPGGSVGVGQMLDPVNDLVEQYASLLLTSATALGVQRVGMQVGRSLGWWLFVPGVLACCVAGACGGGARGPLLAWGRRLFVLAVFARLALPAAGWIDSWVAARFLDADYRAASAAVAATTESIEQADAADDDRPWYERYNPIDAVGTRARAATEALAQVGESVVNLAIYFTISTIVLPLGTLWLLARGLAAVAAPPAAGPGPAAEAGGRAAARPDW